MARKVLRLAVTVIAERDEQGNVNKRLSSLSYSVAEITPDPNAKQVDVAVFNGRTAMPAYDGSATLDQLIAAANNIAKDQGNAT